MLRTWLAPQPQEAVGFERFGDVVEVVLADKREIIIQLQAAPARNAVEVGIQAEVCKEIGRVPQPCFLGEPVSGVENAKILVGKVSVRAQPAGEVHIQVGFEAKPFYVAHILVLGEEEIDRHFEDQVPGNSVKCIDFQVVGVAFLGAETCIDIHAFLRFEQEIGNGENSRRRTFRPAQVNAWQPLRTCGKK